MKAKKRYFIGNFSDVTDEVLAIIGGCLCCSQFTDNEKKTIIFKLPSTDSNEYKELEKFKEIIQEEAITKSRILKPIKEIIEPNPKQ